jgi:alkanesulfonate monooxygenase SsuD/methylene tetrahydromethanopterin reductase-like flavin-dependent oxidoreductase (luciferase family)
VRERIPIYLAGVREGMIRAAASVADGLLGHPIYSLRWTEEVVVPALVRGLKEAGRERENFQLCLGVCCAVDTDVRRARRAAAATIAFYATVKTYEPLFASFPKEVRSIQEALLKGDTSGAAEAVSDDMIDTFAATGDADQVRAQVEPYLALADTVCVSPPDQLIEPAETERYRQALVEVFGE